MMRRLTLVVAIGVVLLALGTVAYADSWGLVPSLTRDKVKGVDTRADSPPELPGQKAFLVLGLETYAWFGPEPALGGAVSVKKKIGSSKKINGTFYGGALVGFSDGKEGVIGGGFLELQIGEIPSIAVLVRREGKSWLINPGFAVNLISWG